MTENRLIIPHNNSEIVIHSALNNFLRLQLGLCKTFGNIKVLKRHNAMYQAPILNCDTETLQIPTASWSIPVVFTK